MAGRLRIIAGQWRGRRLPVAEARELRPTADRHRETLFNWLQGHTAGSRVLDLFAGTGALGLEALSRGAAHAVFVERARPLADSLQAILERLDAARRAEVVAADARRFLARPPQAFDLVFLDPPFRSHLLAEVIGRLDSRGWLAPGARVYVESARQLALPPLPVGWSVLRERTAGDVHFALLAVACDW